MILALFVTVRPQFSQNIQLQKSVFNQFTVILDFSDPEQFNLYDNSPDKLEKLEEFCKKYTITIPKINYKYKIMPYIQEACEIQFNITSFKTLNTSIIFLFGESIIAQQQINLTADVVINYKLLWGLLLTFASIFFIYCIRYWSRRQEELTAAISLYQLIQHQKTIDYSITFRSEKQEKVEKQFNFRDYYLINPSSLGLDEEILSQSYSTILLKGVEYYLQIISVNSQNINDIMKASSQIKDLIGYSLVGQVLKHKNVIKYYNPENIDENILDSDFQHSFYLALLFNLSDEQSLQSLLNSAVKIVSQFGLSQFILDDFYAQQHLVAVQEIKGIVQQLESELAQEEEKLDIQPLKSNSLNIDNPLGQQLDIWALVQKDLERQQNPQLTDLLKNQDYKFRPQSLDNDIISMCSQNQQDFNSINNDIVSVQSFVSDTFNNNNQYKFDSYKIQTRNSYNQFENQLTNQLDYLTIPKFELPQITPILPTFEQPFFPGGLVDNQGINLFQPPIFPSFDNIEQLDLYQPYSQQDQPLQHVHNNSEEISQTGDILNFGNQSSKNSFEFKSEIKNQYYPHHNTEKVSENTTMFDTPHQEPVSNLEIFPPTDLFSPPAVNLPVQPPTDLFSPPAVNLPVQPPTDLFSPPAVNLPVQPPTDLFSPPAVNLPVQPPTDLFSPPAVNLPVQPPTDLFSPPGVNLPVQPPTDLFSPPAVNLPVQPPTDLFSPPAVNLPVQPPTDLFSPPAVNLPVQPPTDLFSPPGVNLPVQPPTDLFSPPGVNLPVQPPTDLFSPPAVNLPVQPPTDLFSPPGVNLPVQPPTDLFSPPGVNLPVQPPTDLFSPPAVNLPVQPPTDLFSPPAVNLPVQPPTDLFSPPAVNLPVQPPTDLFSPPGVNLPVQPPTDLFSPPGVNLPVQPPTDLFSPPGVNLPVQPPTDLFSPPAVNLPVQPPTDLFSPPAVNLPVQPPTDLFSPPAVNLPVQPPTDLFSPPGVNLPVQPPTDLFSPPAVNLPVQPPTDLFSPPGVNLPVQPPTDLFSPPGVNLPVQPPTDLFSPPAVNLPVQPPTDLFSPPAVNLPVQPPTDLFSPPAVNLPVQPPTDLFSPPAVNLPVQPPTDLFSPPAVNLPVQPPTDLFSPPAVNLPVQPPTDLFSPPTLTDPFNHSDQNQFFQQTPIDDFIPFQNHQSFNFASGLTSPPSDIKFQFISHSQSSSTSSQSSIAKPTPPKHIKSTIIQKAATRHTPNNDSSTSSDHQKITDVSQLNPKTFFNILSKKLNPNKLEDIKEESEGLLGLLDYPSVSQAENFNLLPVANSPQQSLDFIGPEELFQQLPQNFASLLVVGGPIFRLRFACFSILNYGAASNFVDFERISIKNVRFSVEKEGIEYSINIQQSIFAELQVYNQFSGLVEGALTQQRQKVVSACVGIGNFVYLRGDFVLGLRGLIDVGKTDAISQLILSFAVSESWGILLEKIRDYLVSQ